jgi:hypothetical protein
MTRPLLRIGIALAVTVWSGVVGALVGLAMFYLHPAQYSSTARVVVGADQAANLVATAKNTTTLSTAIVVADLFHRERSAVPLDDLARRLPLTVTNTPANSGKAALLEVSLTYGDQYRVQRALDSVVRHMVAENPPPYVPGGAYALNSRNASAGVRTAGFEPGPAMLVGFIAGIMLYAVYVHARYRPPVPAPANHPGGPSDRGSRAITLEDLNRLS